MTDHPADPEVEHEADAGVVDGGQAYQRCEPVRGDGAHRIGRAGPVETSVT